MVNPTYSSIKGCAGKKFFKCAPLAATISTTSCQSNWRRAQTLPPDAATPIQRCRTCALGAKHCGAEIVERSPLFATSVCPRCRRGGARMIAGRLCVSCSNRQAEFRKGRNSKGSKPALKLEPRRVTIIAGYGGADQRCIDVRDDLTKDGVELLVQVLRVLPGRLAFCRPRGRPTILMAQLAKQHAAEPQPRANFVMLKRSPPKMAPPAGRPARRETAPSVDRLPNEFRNHPHPRSIDPGAALARLLSRKVAS
jgi:hypothetical protein